ncbi:MAG TPA: hypothetical protein VNT50_11715 [Microbacterium sp.]|uniref:hypothetical protein n=1 Tax=Microbacterium sp. TaxID=51671 RepID=UPI002D0415D7|nr:hypothetical protein [Microbacterium sp.]HWI32150.1 hypothetical protein [Microbacterium sp.]
MSTPPEAGRPLLTPAMLRVMIVVGSLVVVGLIIAAWLFLGSPNRGADDVAATPVASSPTQGPVPGATPTTGSEVLPPSESSGIRLPSLAPAEPLIAAPFPASASSDNELVAGFPADIMGPMPGSDVLNSSIAAEGDTMQVALVARTNASQEEIQAHFRAAWASLGLSAAAEGSAEGVSYAGPYESLALSFSPSSGTGTVYAIYGVFRAS